MITTHQIEPRDCRKLPGFATRPKTKFFHHDNGLLMQNRLNLICKRAAGKFCLTRLIVQILLLSTTIWFTTEQGIKNLLDSFLAAKSAQFFGMVFLNCPKDGQMLYIVEDGQWIILLYRFFLNSILEIEIERKNIVIGPIWNEIWWLKKRDYGSIWNIQIYF